MFSFILFQELYEIPSMPVKCTTYVYYSLIQIQKQSVDLI